MSYLCPVCGFDQLEDPPVNDEICPSCGTHFGYHDATRPHQELTLKWIFDGMPWRSPVERPPLNWNPRNQLANIGYAIHETAEYTETQRDTVTNVYGYMFVPDVGRILSYG